MIEFKWCWATAESFELSSHGVSSHEECVRSSGELHLLFLVHQRTTGQGNVQRPLGNEESFGWEFIAWGVGVAEVDCLNMGLGAGDGTTMTGISMTRTGCNTCGVVDQWDRKSDTVLIKRAEASLRTSANNARCGPAIWSAESWKAPYDEQQIKMVADPRNQIEPAISMRWRAFSWLKTGSLRLYGSSVEAIGRELRRRAECQ